MPGNPFPLSHMFPVMKFGEQNLTVRRKQDNCIQPVGDSTGDIILHSPAVRLPAPDIGSRVRE